jgi:hypothetical protein
MKIPALTVLFSTFSFLFYFIFGSNENQYPSLQNN